MKKMPVIVRRANEKGIEPLITCFNETQYPYFLSYIKFLVKAAFDEQDPLEIWQNSLIELWIDIQNSKVENLWGYIHTIVKHNCLDALRKTGRNHEQLSDEVLAKLISQDTTNYSLLLSYESEQITKSKLVAKIIEIINGLPHRQKMVARAYLESLEEITPNDIFRH